MHPYEYLMLSWILLASWTPGYPVSFSSQVNTDQDWKKRLFLSVLKHPFIFEKENKNIIISFLSYSLATVACLLVHSMSIWNSPCF